MVSRRGWLRPSRYEAIGHSTVRPCRAMSCRTGLHLDAEVLVRTDPAATHSPVDSCGLTTCHNSPESTTTCCGGLWVNCGTLWRSYHNSPQNVYLVVVTCGDHNSLPTTRHNPPTTLLTTCHILPQLTHTLPHPTHNFSIIILQFDQFHSINTMITSANCVQFLYTVLVYVGGVDHS